MALHKFLKKVQRKKNYQEHEGTSEELTAVKKKKKKSVSSPWIPISRGRAAQASTPPGYKTLKPSQFLGMHFDATKYVHCQSHICQFLFASCSLFNFRRLANS